MNRYVLKFAKEGYSRFTSHLDMLRMFKRAFKRTGIALVYSQGFNPHPKLGFAQPLSLGYTSACELLEFETEKPYRPEQIVCLLSPVMPEGIEILGCSVVPEGVKSLASAAAAAEYTVILPAPAGKNYADVLRTYLAQDEIFVEKKQKKTKKMISVDIRPKIRSIVVVCSDPLTLHMCLDSGSQSNLSPEQVLSSFIAFAEIPVSRAEISVRREKLIFDKNLQF